MRSGALALLSLAVLVPPAAADEAEDRAVAFIAWTQGSVQRDGKAPGRPVIAAQLGSRVTADGMKLLAGLPRLEELTAAHIPFTDAMLKELPALPELKPAEIGLAKQIIQQIAHETFEPEKYKDEVQERMMQLINQKVEGQEITVTPEAPVGKVIDLMEALKASLGMSKSDDRKPAIAAAEATAAEAPKKKAAASKKK